MKFLSEYNQNERTAHIYKKDNGKYTIQMFIDETLIKEFTVSSEQLADDYAEDWSRGLLEF